MLYKKIAFFIVIIIMIMAINNLSQSTYSTWQKQDLIVKAQKDLEDVKEENQRLRSELARVEKPEFIESEARDKLFLTKPGENIIVIPTGSLALKPSVTPPPTDTRENWQKWWETFF